MNCPRCATPLENVALEGSAAERCKDCGGTWFTRASFRAAADQADAESGWHAFELWRDAENYRGVASDLACPSCAKTMARLTYGEVEVQVEACPECEGVWFDADEFDRTVDALRDELMTIPTTDLLTAAFEEAAEIARSEGALTEEWRHFTRVARLIEQRVLADHPLLRKLLVSLQGGGGFP